MFSYSEEQVLAIKGGRVREYGGKTIKHVGMVVVKNKNFFTSPVLIAERKCMTLVPVVGASFAIKALNVKVQDPSGEMEILFNKEASTIMNNLPNNLRNSKNSFNKNILKNLYKSVFTR